MFKKICICCIVLLSNHLFAESKMPKIVVVGAGLSGLTTAYRLHEKGFDVAVYEAKERVGGRVFTVNIQGHLVELGGQNIYDGGEALNMIALIDELGLETESEKSKLRLQFLDNNVLIDAQEVFKNLKYTHKGLKEKLEKVGKEAHNMEEVLQAIFPKMSLLYKICSTVLAGYEGASSEKLSPLYIETLYHLLTGGLSSAHKEQNIENESYIDHLIVKGGNALLAEKMAHKLDEKVYLNHPLVKVEKTKQGAYLLSFRNGKEVLADFVILAIPCPVYSDISMSDAVISKSTKKKIESIAYGTTTKISVPLKSSNKKEGSFSNGRMIAFMNRDNSVVNVYYIKENGKFAPTTMETVYQKDLPLLQRLYQVDPSLKLTFALDKLFEKYSGPVGYSWPNDPFTKGSYSFVAAGQEELFTSLEEIEGEVVKTLFAPIGGTLFFAGEHASTLLDVGGTMEAAVDAGEKAARLVEKFAIKKSYH